MSIDEKIRNTKHALIRKTQNNGLGNPSVYVDSFIKVHESILIPLYSIGSNESGDICGGFTDIVEITKEDIAHALL